jgi:hypothetical protein
MSRSLDGAGGDGSGAGGGEAAGARFDITGCDVSGTVRLGRLRGMTRTIHPAVERRGVRLHINFAMDISSYPLEEAKAYIRNLARLRMNTVTFHSYPGQWYPASLEGGPMVAGIEQVTASRVEIGDEETDPALVKKCAGSMVPVGDEEQAGACQ